ncbi:transposable element Tcb2 transposase [Trichonephila clavipes]|nr:transposable element Tcb2 transposase [Trichonephila clavipes]
MSCVTVITRHLHSRREWATVYVNWRRIQWRNILFFDEYRFSGHSDNRRVFILRERGTRKNHAFVRGNVRFCCGGVLVCAGISIDGRTGHLIILNGALTGHRYKDEILRPMVVPYVAAIGDDFMVMGDNCKRQRANLWIISFSRKESYE